jgi:hypothetical protein
MWPVASLCGSVVADLSLLVVWVARQRDSWIDTSVSEKHTVSIFNPEDGGNIFFRNITTQKTNNDTFTAVRTSNLMQ